MLVNQETPECSLLQHAPPHPPFYHPLYCSSPAWSRLPLGSAATCHLCVALCRQRRARLSNVGETCIGKSKADLDGCVAEEAPPARASGDAWCRERVTRRSSWRSGSYSVRRKEEKTRQEKKRKRREEEKETDHGRAHS